MLKEFGFTLVPLDHKNALKNYLSRGMKIYNIETVSTKSA